MGPWIKVPWIKPHRALSKSKGSGTLLEGPIQVVGCRWNRLDETSPHEMVIPLLT